MIIDHRGLPTIRCIVPHHQREGGCFACCDRCNHDRHQCPGCGDSLRHDGRQHDGEIHPCLTKCECGHIGYDHGLVSCDDCDCVEYRPVSA